MIGGMLVGEPPVAGGIDWRCVGSEPPVAGGNDGTCAGRGTTSPVGNDRRCAGRGTPAPSHCLGYITCMIDEKMNEYEQGALMDS